MQIVLISAPDRCEPCRDMDARIQEVLELKPLTSAGIRIIHADRQEAEAAKYNAKVIPTILLVNEGEELFRAEGRITSVLFETLVDAVLLGTYDPEEFREHAPSGNVVFYRTYSRRTESDQRETFKEAIHRVAKDIKELGQFTEDEEALVLKQALGQHALPSGRWLWVGGTQWIKQQENFSGAYNCTSTNVDSLEAFGLMMELAMMGSGTGAILEKDMVAKLPKILNRLKITKVTELGTDGGDAETRMIGKFNEASARIIVGDSRKGWVSAYQRLIELAYDPNLRARLNKDGNDCLKVIIDLSQVRPAGRKLKGFGGTSNPVKLGDMFKKVASLLSQAQGRKLSAVECCLLIDEAAACIVAGNIRRSAGMRQFSWDDLEAKDAKDNLYTQDAKGNWKVDPIKENLRMANHTRCAHTKPSLEDVKAAVTKQFFSGEGAIQYVPEAIARSSADLFETRDDMEAFMEMYEQGYGKDFLCSLIDVERPDMHKEEKEEELTDRLQRYGLNPCGEILGHDFHCNLAEVHLNTIDPRNIDAQIEAFQAAGLQVAALLHHEFAVDRYAYSRMMDPIVGVSFTGLFDFFVHAFGEPWLAWMMAGRPNTQEGYEFIEKEKGYLGIWRRAVHTTVKEYCERHDLKVPNRTTTVQPAGTKSLLTGASSGWHPPKAQRFIRRITVGANDPVALAAMEYGFSVIPAQSARDEEGNLLDDINDPRSTEWLIEIPTEVSWANIPGVDQHDLSQLSAAAQFGLYMSVQTHYTEHNTSATIEFREHEIDQLAELIHGHMGKGYISAALLARFDANATFPRLPFEPISKEVYDEMVERVSIRGEGCEDFHQALAKHDSADFELTTSAACTSAACIASADRAEAEGKV
ncbi:ribonucleoside-triphosphate reductase/ adenosylcobalamin-dependent [Synechococcus sp. SYN20]|uniref:ribonucleoside-triphosphate reductase, adenosylcobalamin-dependent n=1 Tax=Synechococcus sp. SYN20 TaxID=1050714 RepID=UPI00185FDD61|nr:ribonucleoside-triphosphate reductase, adenosylcobalamin-dependent [Synechococcus sp. SYN20]QNJ25912.1 ribonucleoside-triphosphate reductase/ adenosylcobalamin-dependent [Synechococcus sp. SYN20]